MSTVGTELNTLLVVLTVAPAWRSIPTIEWLLEAAMVSAVFLSCEEVEGGMLLSSYWEQHMNKSIDCVK